MAESWRTFAHTRPMAPNGGVNHETVGAAPSPQGTRNVSQLVASGWGNRASNDMSRWWAVADAKRSCHWSGDPRWGHAAAALAGRAPETRYSDTSWRRDKVSAASLSKVGIHSG